MMTTEITAYEAARQLGLSESQVCRLIRQGKIRARKLGYMWLVDADSLSYTRHRRPRTKEESNNES
jgi:excisionase family DNA binding protein